MMHRKVSLSLSEADVRLLDAEVLDGRFPSRSAAVQAAVRMLKESHLADAYAEAYAEDYDEAWDDAAGDGLASA